MHRIWIEHSLIIIYLQVFTWSELDILKNTGCNGKGGIPFLFISSSAFLSTGTTYLGYCQRHPIQIWCSSLLCTACSLLFIYYCIQKYSVFKNHWSKQYNGILKCYFTTHLPKSLFIEYCFYHGSNNIIHKPRGLFVKGYLSTVGNIKSKRIEIIDVVISLALWLSNRWWWLPWLYVEGFLLDLSVLISSKDSLQSS